MGAKYRLMQYRSYAAKATHDIQKDWRYWVHGETYTDNPTYSKDRKQMFLNSFSIGDDLGTADKLNRHIDHTGWYCDSFQSGAIAGHVIKLRCPKGTLYIPATKCTEWDGVTYYLDNAYLIEKGKEQYEHDNAIYEVSKTADRCAELEAEDSREEDAKYQAESQIDELEEENKGLQEEIDTINEELSDCNLPHVIIEVCRNRVKSCEFDIKNNENRIEELKDNYWKAVENW